MKIVNGESVTIEVIEEIVDRFEYVDEQQRKAAFDKCNNAVFEQTDLDELEAIAKPFSVEA
jgi:hypothetical protein